MRYATDVLTFSLIVALESLKAGIHRLGNQESHAPSVISTNTITAIMLRAEATTLRQEQEVLVQDHSWDNLSDAHTLFNEHLYMEDQRMRQLVAGNSITVESHRLVINQDNQRSVLVAH